MANSLPRLIVLNGWDVIRRQYDRIRGSFISKTERSGSQCTYMYTKLKLEMHKIVETEPVFANVYAVQGSIPPAYVAWRAGTTNGVAVPRATGWESIPGLLERFTNKGSDISGYLSTNMEWKV
jgi:hypothetical protein